MTAIAMARIMRTRAVMRPVNMDRNACTTSYTMYARRCTTRSPYGLPSRVSRKYPKIWEQRVGWGGNGCWVHRQRVVRGVGVVARRTHEKTVRRMVRASNKGEESDDTIVVAGLRK